jgi:hypothetical protein
MRYHGGMTKKLRWAWLGLLPPLLAFGFAQSPAGASGKVGSDCTFNGHKLYGKVKIVDAFPDLKVQVVTAFPDLKVQKVDNFPDACGKWKVVDNFPDLKIQFVKAFPDLTIKYVTAFPGLP